MENKVRGSVSWPPVCGDFEKYVKFQILIYTLVYHCYSVQNQQQSLESALVVRQSQEGLEYVLMSSNSRIIK